jgi:hypothetical protein
VTLSQLLLAAAIIIVFLLWRRARNQVAAARADIEAHRDRNTFTFEADEAARALTVLDAGGAPVDPRSLRWDEHGLELVDADRRAGFHADLSPGTPLELREVDGRVEVHIPHGDTVLADVGGPAGPALAGRLAADEVGGCIVLRQPEPDDPTLSLLVIHRAVDIEL